MLISHKWLRQLTGTKLDPQQVRERLTSVGLAVDAVEERGDDFVLDVEVASNRGDCLSHVGVARELAVIEKSAVQSPNSKVEQIEGKSSDFASVEIIDAELCPRYAARVIRGVKIAPSPDWLVKQIEAIGQRPINNVADITNYVLHELGQPLHAFDLAKLGENRIVVRRAVPEESITTLDGVERKLDAQMLVIADAHRPVAVAGVMGGQESEISAATVDVLIESACFDPASVRRTSRMLGLHTEASHRFERSVDLNGVLKAQERCVALICEIAGGVATTDVIDVYPRSALTKLATLRPERVLALTGLQVEREEMLRILSALGFELREDAGQIVFAVPSWRHDVAIEEDLIEEVARHTGFEKIATALPPASLAGEYHSAETRKRALRRALSSLGFDEAINFSFIELTNEFELLPHFKGRGEESLVTLTNPIIEDASRMRATLLPGLLKSTRHNLNQGIRDLGLFELGRVFASFAPGELPHERESLGLLLTGGMIEAGKTGASREVDFFDLKGALEAAVAAMNIPAPEFASARVKHLRAGQSASVSIEGTPIGSLGRLADSAAAGYKFRQPVYVAEIDLTTLAELKESPVLYSPLPRFPSIVRDVSLLVDRKTSVGELLRAAADRTVENCLGARFVGAYGGEGIPEGKRSVTLRFEYRSPDRTLRDEEVDELHWPLVNALKEKFAAEVR